jgi:hypothetical protein
MHSLLSDIEMHQLRQLIQVTCDGNLMSKDARNKLVERMYVQQLEGWNWLTKIGVKVLIDSGFLHA